MFRLTRFIPAVLLVLTVAACGQSASAPTPTSVPEQPAAAPTVAAPADASLPTGVHTYVIVPAETTASYSMDEEFFGGALSKYGIPSGKQDTIGRTNAVSGQFQLNWDDLTAPLGDNSFVVDLSTLKSDQSLRDGWIRDNGPKFGESPEATFVADSLANAPTSYAPSDEVSFDMVGQLTIRGITHPATFAVTATYQDKTITGVAIAALKLTDFGITPPDFANTLTVKDDFEAKLEFTASEQ